MPSGIGGIHSKGTGNLRAGVVYLYDWHSGRSGFFHSFRSKGKTLILITLLIVASACLTGVGMKYLFDIDTPSIVGLIAGALTSTPGLAVAIDSTQSPLASIAYGIAYPFGVIGVILFVKLLPKLMGIDLNEEARRLEKERRSSSLN